MYHRSENTFVMRAKKLYVIKKTLTVVSFLLCETFSIMKKPEKHNTNRAISLITGSPEQYEGFDGSNEELDFDECKNDYLVFDDILIDEKLRDSNQKTSDPFSTKGRHKGFDVNCLSQSYFDLSKGTTKKAVP